MKPLIRQKVTFLAVAAVSLITLAGFLLAREAETAKIKPAPPLIPVFSTASDCPEFVLDYVNDTGKPVDIIDLHQSSSAVIDGKLYPGKGVPFVGNPNLAPGQTHSFVISLFGYLPKGERKGYSKTLKRWRWIPALESGQHTVLVKFGAMEYGPITFIWKGDVPLLYE